MPPVVAPPLVAAAPPAGPPASAQPGWGREAVAGAVAGLVTLALLLSLGILAWSPIGGEAARLGTAGAFTCAVLSAAVYALGGPSRLPTGAPTAPSTLMIMAVVTTLVADPGFHAAPAARVPWVVGGVALTVVAAGLTQIALAGLGWVQLVRQVPQTVLAGFMNAIALLVLMSQAAPLLGFSLQSLAAQGPAALAQFRPGSLLLGLGVAALVFTLARRRPRWPAALMALVGGTLVHALLTTAPFSLPLGPTVGALQPELPIVQTWAALGDAEARAYVMRHAVLLLGTGVAIGVVGMLESLLVVLSIAQQHAERVDLRRELAFIGLGNVIGGACGAVPMGMVRSRAAAVTQAGGQGWRAALAVSAMQAAMYFAGAPLLAWLPVAVLAGIMVTVSWALVDPWTRGLIGQVRRGERAGALAQSLGVVAFVLVLTVWQGPVFGVGLGIAVAIVLFIRQLSGALVRQRYSAAERPSRRVYPPALVPQLAALRPAIQVLELEGTLFFGNLDHLGRAADALPAGARELVLDLRRVTTIDETGALGLAQLGARLARQGLRLRLAGVQPDDERGRRLRLYGASAAEAADWSPDADRAIEAAEQALLKAQASEAQADAASSLGTTALASDLTAAEVQTLATRLQTLRCAAGDTVFRRGEPADAVFVVLRGSVSIVGGSVGRSGDVRYVSLSPGTMFGEAAVLDGGGRTADARADVDSELLRLDAATLDALAQAEPALGAKLYRNMARYLAQRLRVASAAWVAAG